MKHSDLQRYIFSGEHICFVFGIGTRYFFFIFFVILVSMGIPMLIFISIPIIFWSLLIILCFWEVIWCLRFVNTCYFVTNHRIYKRSGTFFTSLYFANRVDITDMKINQSIFEKIIFNTGTILINTKGGPEYEVILKRVNAPYKIKKKVASYWPGGLLKG